MADPEVPGQRGRGLNLPPNTAETNRQSEAGPKEPENRERLARRFLRGRTLFGAVTSNDLLTARASLDVLIDLTGDAEKMEQMAIAFKRTSYDRFIDGFSQHFKVPKDELVQNERLREVFLELRDMTLDVQKRKLARKKFMDLKVRVNKGLVGYVGERPEDAEKFYNSYIKIEKDRHVATRIFSLEKSEDPRLVKLVQDYRQEMLALDEDFKKGIISEEEYLAKRDVINERVVKESGDISLQEEWTIFKRDESFNDAMEIIPDDANENRVTDKEEVRSAFAEVADYGLPVDIHDDGSASLALGDEKFPVDISVFRNQKSGELVFYIVDNYSDNGIVKVDSDESLMDALDKRYIDAYLSDKLGAIPGNEDSPHEILDQDLISLCEKLIEKGDKRGYKFSDDHKVILNALVDVLMLKDQKYPSFYAKVQILDDFIETEENATFVRGKLLGGDVHNFQTLLGELD